MSVFFEISGLNIYLQIAVTLISIGIHFIVMKNKRMKETPVELIAIYTIGLAGWFSIMSGLMGHILFADQVATSIGWPLQSGFQMELAFASMGIGLVGFIGFFNRQFWLPFIIAKTTFLWGAAFTHILHIINQSNLSPSNTGIVLYWDIFFPIVLIALYAMTKRQH